MADAGSTLPPSNVVPIRECPDGCGLEAEIKERVNSYAAICRRLDTLEAKHDLSAGVSAKMRRVILGAIMLSSVLGPMVPGWVGDLLRAIGNLAH